MKKTLNNNPNYVLFLGIMFVIGGCTCLYFEFAPPSAKDSAAAEAADGESGDAGQEDEAPVQAPGRHPGEGGPPRLLLWGGVICILLGCAGITRSFLLRHGKDFTSDSKQE